MMRKVRALVLVLAAGMVAGSYATDARVLVMGRQNTPWFYRDEISVFTNPGDISLYPNMIYGSYGWVEHAEQGTLFTTSNMNPNDPFFGAMFSAGLGGDEGGPAFSIGAFVNRRDPMVTRLLNAGGRKEGTGAGYNLVEPLGKFDLILGYDLGTGVSLGLGAYATLQTEQVNSVIQNQTEFYKGSVGVNWNIEQGLDFEASVNVGITNAQFRRNDSAIVVSDNEYFMRGDVRFFSAIPAINGAFVPQVSLEYLKLAERDITDLNGGIGVNMNIDRGFFFTGLQGVYTQINSQRNDVDDEQSIGARLTFGIERNIIWDWFLIRVGGMKELRYVTLGENKGTYWWENASSDGSDFDLVSLGFGLNIDNRLRIDFVVSESLPFTLTNLISGNQHHLFSRVSATYRF